MMNQEQLSLLGRLSKPTGKIDVVLDTDTYNEVDDQFALSYLLCLAEGKDARICLKAICAAPFHNGKSQGPEDGMEKKLSGNPPYPGTDGKAKICRSGVQGIPKLDEGRKNAGAF